MPLRGRIVPELRAQGVQFYRELLSPPYRIMYRVKDRLVLVVAVLDGRRNLDDLLLDRFLR